MASLLSSRHWNPSSRSIPLPPLAPSHKGARVRDPCLQPPSTGPCRYRRPPPCLLLSSPLSLFLLSRLRAARAYMSQPWLPPEHELRPGWVTYPLKILSRSTQIARLVQTSLSTARLHQVVYTRFVVDTQVATHRLACRLVSTSPSTRNQCMHVNFSFAQNMVTLIKKQHRKFLNTFFIF